MDKIEEVVAAAESAPAPKAKAKEKAKEKSTMTVVVPKDFKLRVSHDSVVDYKAGVCEMPPEHATHWYSKANGVQIYNS
jgi:hypothetical protein